MTRLGPACPLLGVFAGDYAIVINGELTDFDISAGVCAVTVRDRVSVEGRKAATTVEQAIAQLEPSVVGYLTVRRAEAAVSASQPAEYHARAQRDEPAAAGRSHHRSRWLRGSLWIRAVPFAADVLLKRESLASNDSESVTYRDLADDFGRGRLVPGCMIG